MRLTLASASSAFGRFFIVCVLALGVGQAHAAENIGAQVSAAAESSHVFCNAAGTGGAQKAPCFIRSLYVTTGAAAGYLMVFNAVSAPADGAVTPAECVIAPANSTVSVDFGETTRAYVTGLVAVFSTTGCFTKTASATAFFNGRVQ
jgi:hypothetical protein